MTLYSPFMLAGMMLITLFVLFLIVHVLSFFFFLNCFIVDMQPMQNPQPSENSVAGAWEATTVRTTTMGYCMECLCTVHYTLNPYHPYSGYLNMLGNKAQPKAGCNTTCK